jgi:hypothetical protein
VLRYATRVGRDEIEAHPGFLGWLRFGDDAPEGAVRVVWDRIGEHAVAFGEAGRSLDVLEVTDALGGGPDDQSHMWDGSQEGWTLIGSRRHEVIVALRTTLGELSAPRLRALRSVWGDARLDACSAFDMELSRGARTAEQAAELAALVRAAGFDCEVRTSVDYVPHRERNGHAVVTVIEDDEEHTRITQRMLAAGVRVEWRDDEEL